MPSWQEERRRLARRHMPWRGLTLSQLLAELAGRHPDRRYLIAEDRTWTYAEVAAWSRRLSIGLRRLGIAPGDRVAITLPNGPQRVAMEFAIAAAGGVSVQLSPHLTRPEVEELYTRTGSALVVDGELAGRVEEASRGTQKPPGQGNAPFATPAVIFPAAHESGRTALVLLTHDQLLRSAFGSAYTRAFEDGRTILFALPLSHVFGYVEGMLAALFCAGAIIPQAAFSPEATFAAIELHRATDALFVPAMTLSLLRHRPGTHDLSSLRAVMSAGARSPSWIWPALRELLGVERLTNGYGQTETAGSSTLTGPEASDRELDETVGPPKLWPDGPLLRYRVVDPATGAPLPAGQEGELCARGPSVTGGYADDDELTARALAGGWLRSGDLGRVRADGDLELTGRLKLLLRTGAENVSPREVEAVLRGHPDVAAACVVGVPDARLGEVVAAWIAVRQGVPFDAGALRSYCRGRLARHKVPRHFLPSAHLPLEAQGEPDRARLRDLATAELGRGERDGWESA